MHVKRQGAFTLVELLMVMAIIAVVAAFAVPTYQSMIFKGRVATATSALHRDLLLARSEAIKRGVIVAICRSENPESVLPSCATTNSLPTSNTGWGAGWILFTDLNNNGTYEPGNAPSEILIRVQGRLITKKEDGSIIPNPQRKFISFNSTGQTFGAFMQFAVNRADADTDVTHDRFICIASGGRARVDKTLCTN